MRSRGQEPYIAFTLENIMKEAGFDFITSIQRDTYLGMLCLLESIFLAHKDDDLQISPIH